MDMGKRREERLPRRKRSGEKKIGEVENITRRPVSQLLRNSERIGDTLCTRTKAKEMAKTHFGLFLLLLFWTLDKVTLLPTCHKFPQLASKFKKKAKFQPEKEKPGISQNLQIFNLHFFNLVIILIST